MKSSSCGFGVSSIYQQAWKSYKPYLLVCVSEKQIILSLEDTAIFIRQMKWTWCLLFFRHLHSCSMEFLLGFGLLLWPGTLSLAQLLSLTDGSSINYLVLLITYMP